MYPLLYIFLSQTSADPLGGLLTSSNPILVAIGIIFVSLMSVDKLAFWMQRRKNGNGNHNDARKVVECLEGIQAQLVEMNKNMAVLLDRSGR